MKVLVTGASGMLGAGIARALAERGDEVTVLQRRPSGLALGPDSLDSPGALGLSDSPNSSGSSASRSAPASSGSLDSPDYNSPASADSPTSPDSPRSPSPASSGSLDSPSFSYSPDSPGAPAFSNSPDSPRALGKSGSADSPSSSGAPISLGSPSSLDSPSSFDSSASRGAPDSPGAPASSDSPNSLDSSASRGAPASSHSPDSPGALGKSDSADSPSPSGAPVSLDSPSSPSGSVPRIREVLGDICDPVAVARAVEGQDAIVHLAAKVNVTGRWEDYLRINVEGTRTLLAAAAEHGVARFVHASSPSVAHAGSSIVGEGAGPADPDHARGNYARSKAMSERLALAADTAARADGTGPAVVVIRPHLVWGPGDTQLVARVIRRAKAGRLPVIGTGAALVDTTYIDNAVDALVAALDRCEQVRGESFVVSNGEPRPVSEIFAAWARAGGADTRARRIPTRLALLAGTAVDAVTAVRERFGVADETDPPLTRFLVEQLTTAHWFDQRRTREALDWAPKVSLDEGFARLAASGG